LLFKFSLFLHLRKLAERTILVEEEPTLGTSQFKVPMNLKTIELNPLREIGRPCGVRKALIEFKLYVDGGYERLLTN
jgi:hypothetical protein